MEKPLQSPGRLPSPGCSGGAFKSTASPVHLLDNYLQNRLAMKSSAGQSEMANEDKQRLFARLHMSYADFDHAARAAKLVCAFQPR
jgi:hypothetical protein